MKKIIKYLLVIGLIASAPIVYLAYQFLWAPATLNEVPYHLYIYNEFDAEDIAEVFVKDGVLKDPSDFLKLAERKNLKNKNIVPGKYKIMPRWSYNKLINHLRAGNGRLEVSLSFHNVRTLEDLSGMMAKDLRVDSLEILHWLHHPDSIAHYGFNHYNIMSLFIPDTYHVDWNISVPDLMKRMAKEYRSFWNDERKMKANQIGLSQSDVYTLASIVNAETKYSADIPTVAGVYINRIHSGMPLQADPTLIFAIGDFSIKRVLDKDKQVDSPYNTYKNLGLPPGPINLPPKKYLDGVLNYERHSYYYFCAKEDFSGASNFAKTYAQHLRNAAKYHAAMNKNRVYR